MARVAVAALAAMLLATACGGGNDDEAGRPLTFRAEGRDYVVSCRSIDAETVAAEYDRRGWAPVRRLSGEILSTQHAIGIRGSVAGCSGEWVYGTSRSLSQGQRARALLELAMCCLGFAEGDVGRHSMETVLIAGRDYLVYCDPVYGSWVQGPGRRGSAPIRGTDLVDARAIATPSTGCELSVEWVLGVSPLLPLRQEPPIVHRVTRPSGG